MPGFESRFGGGPPPMPELQATPEKKEEKTVSRSFEYRNLKGELLGTATVEWSEELRKDLDPHKGEYRLLKAMTITGTKDGAPATVDVLALAEAGDCEIRAFETKRGNYSYNNTLDVAKVPSPETPTNTGTLLHELGHRAQYRDAGMKPITPLYGAGKKRIESQAISYSELRKDVLAVVDAVPEARNLIDAEADEECLRISQESIKTQMQQGGLLRERLMTELEREIVAQDEIAAALKTGLPKEFWDDVESMRAARAEGKRDTSAEASARTKRWVAYLEEGGFSFAQRDERNEMPVVTEPDEEPRMPWFPRTAFKTPQDVLTFLDDVAEKLKPGHINTWHVPGDEGDVGLLQVQSALSNRSDVGKSRFENYSDFRIAANLRISNDVHATFAEKARPIDLALQSIDERVSDFETHLDDLDHELRTVLLRTGLGGTLQDIVKLPTRMMERDATRRAYQWMRIIRELTGVDLFTEHTVVPQPAPQETPEGAAEPDEHACEESMRAERVSTELETTDVFGDLSAALRTYGAQHPQRLRPVNVPPPDLERRAATEELRKKREEEKRNAEKSE